MRRGWEDLEKEAGGEGGGTLKRNIEEVADMRVKLTPVVLRDTPKRNIEKMAEFRFISILVLLLLGGRGAPGEGDPGKEGAEGHSQEEHRENG